MNNEELQAKFDVFEDVVREHSKRETVGEGEVCYPFLAGYLPSFYSSLLTDLELTNEQIKKVNARIDYHIDKLVQIN